MGDRFCCGHAKQGCMGPDSPTWKDVHTGPDRRGWSGYKVTAPFQQSVGWSDWDRIGL